MLYVGIDPGEKTGFAVWDSTARKFRLVQTRSIVGAMDYLHQYWTLEPNLNDIRIVFEDARLRKWIPRERNASEYRGKLMGAGSVKRDCTIWEEFCKEYGFTYEAVPPAAGRTKWSPETFRAVTGYEERTSNHGRDAAMLVFGR